MAGVVSNNAGISNEYKAFVNAQYAGYAKDNSIESMQKGIEAKKNIMAHPECTEKEKSMLKKEIALLESKINTANLEADYKDFAEQFNKPLKEKYNRSADSFELSSATLGVMPQNDESDKRPAFLKKLFPPVGPDIDGIVNKPKARWNV